MKILAIADRPPRSSIRKLVTENQIDLICTLGDLDYYSLRELELIKDLPKLGVYGNHDGGAYFADLGIHDLHLKTFVFQGLTFGGFQGCVKYKEAFDNSLFTQKESQQLLQAFPPVDVMLTHCPPYGVNDDRFDLSHTGFIGLKEYLERAKPSYLFHGHTYPTTDQLVTKYLDTNIVYVFQDKIMTI